MLAEQSVEEILKSNQIIFFYTYPKIQNANSNDTLFITADGKVINQAKLISVQILKNGNHQIVTEQLSVDENENWAAKIRLSFIFGSSLFKIINEVQFVGENNWLKRHEYSYLRI